MPLTIVQVYMPTGIYRDEKVEEIYMEIDETLHKWGI